MKEQKEQEARAERLRKEQEARAAKDQAESGLQSYMQTAVSAISRYLPWNSQAPESDEEDAEDDVWAPQDSSDEDEWTSGYTRKTDAAPRAPIVTCAKCGSTDHKYSTATKCPAHPKHPDYIGTGVEKNACKKCGGTDHKNSTATKCPAHPKHPDYIGTRTGVEKSATPVEGPPLSPKQVRQWLFRRGCRG